MGEGVKARFELVAEEGHRIRQLSGKDTPLFS
jgi:hypothetical protein